MAKLVVCLDGSGQTLLQTHPTNIALTFSSIGGTPMADASGAYETMIDGNMGLGKYLPGVGTQGDPVLKILGNAFGDGIAEPIIRGYTFLSRSYKTDDEIFIIGFSRGATAARALAGFVVSKGLLNVATYAPAQKTDAYALAVAAWYQYRQPQPNSAQQARLALISGTLGKEVPTPTPSNFTVPPKVQAVGVYDTVSSLGLPHLDSDGDASFDFSICDTTLNPNVLHGFHALAADETRDLFSPTFWASRENVTQHIFPGAHSNVGGGYPERGLSDGALDWMLGELVGVGLPVNPAKIMPAISPKPTDLARDDGATFPFMYTPRHPRAFPESADVSLFLNQRRGQAVETLPSSIPVSYEPVGKRADGSAL